MSLVCRWGGVSVEMGLGERIPASLWDAASKDLFRKNLTQEELHATLILDQKSSEARRSFQMLQASLSRLPTTQEFRAFVKGHFNPTTGVKKPFEVYIEEFIGFSVINPKECIGPCTAHAFICWRYPVVVQVETLAHHQLIDHFQRKLEWAKFMPEVELLCLCKATLFVQDLAMLACS